MTDETAAFARYQLAESLRHRPSVASVRQLIELVTDQTSCVLHEAPAPYDVEPTYGHVGASAEASLVGMLPVALPWIVDALPSTTAEQAVVLLRVIHCAEIAQRMTLPDQAHATIVAATERVDDTRASGVRFEREIASRVRLGELADPERFWRAWLAHPTHASGALYALEKLAPDRAAFALELAQMTDHPGLRYTAASLLAQLPPLLPPDIVQRLAGSSLPREHEDLVPALARHGAAAAALVPLCLEMLDNEPLAEDDSWNSRHLRWDWATAALVSLVDVLEPRDLESRLVAMAAGTRRHQACGERIRQALAARELREKPHDDSSEPADPPIWP